MSEGIQPFTIDESVWYSVETDEVHQVLFTAKHYTKIGEIIGNAMVEMSNRLTPEELAGAQKGVAAIISAMAGAFKEDNPRFKREDFLKCLKPKTIPDPP